MVNLAICNGSEDALLTNSVRRIGCNSLNYSPEDLSFEKIQKDAKSINGFEQGALIYIEGKNSIEKAIHKRFREYLKNYPENMTYNYEGIMSMCRKEATKEYLEKHPEYAAVYKKYEKIENDYEEFVSKQYEIYSKGGAPGVTFDEYIKSKTKIYKQQRPDYALFSEIKDQYKSTHDCEYY